VHRRAGDALYARRDYGAAVAEYCETVGQLEPSYVIRRFLDAQRIHNLAAYLAHLHAKVGRIHNSLKTNLTIDVETEFHLRVELSHALRRFLDAQRIHNLAAYRICMQGGEAVHTCILMDSALDRHHQVELHHPPLPQRTVPPSGGLPPSDACLRANVRAKAKWDQSCQQHVRPCRH